MSVHRRADGTPFVVKTMSDPLPPPGAEAVMQDAVKAMNDPLRCRHCRRTSHGMACCGMLALEIGEVCQIDHHRTTDPDDQNRPHGPSGPVDATARPQHGPTPPRRPVRRIDPRGNR